MKNRNILILLAVLVQATACQQSFLDLTDPTRVSTDRFYENEEQIQQAVNGAYSSLQDHTNNQYLFAEMMSDNTTIQLNPSDRGQTDRAEAFEFWNVAASNVNIAGLYNQCYNALYNINYALSQIDGIAAIEEGKRAQYRGELEFIRAYYYFNLVRYFGPVVLLTTPLVDASDAFATARSSEEEVYAQIILDLSNAAAALPDKKDYSGADVGRASSGAALALLGKVYLTLKDYANARRVLEQVMNQGYALMGDYADVFLPSNKNHVESIFEIQYQGGNNLGEWSSFIYTFAPRDSEGAVTGFPASRPAGWNIPTNDMIAAFEEGDERKAVALQEGYVNGAGQFIAIPFVNKYNHPHTIQGRTDDNWPVLRYADVLLMMAEAVNEGEGPGAAYPYINQVRQRAGVPVLSGLSQEAFRQALRHERRVELAFENDRWFDLKRSLPSEVLTALLNEHGREERASPTVGRGGVPFSGTDYQFEPYMAIFPIPERQLFLNSNMVQNPGY